MGSTAAASVPITLRCPPCLPLPAGMITTNGAVTRVPGGWQVVTTSAYPDARHRSAADLARRLVASSSPFGALALGSDSPPGAGQVFLTEAEVVTGAQRDKMFGTHLVLTSADDTGSTTGKATAAAYPTDAFVRVSVQSVQDLHSNVAGQGRAAHCVCAMPLVLIQAHLLLTLSLLSMDLP